MIKLFLSAVPLILVPLAPAVAQERHNFPISIANPAPADAVRNGPLFKKIEELANSSSEAALADAIVPGASVRVYPKNVPLSGRVEQRKFIETLLKDCQGPYVIDEGSAWVQTSFVCHVGDGRHIKSYFAFDFSPEVSVEFTWKDGRISKIIAGDLLPLPLLGKSKYLPMNAAETIPDKR